VGRLPAEDAYDCKLDYSAAAMRNSVNRSLDLLDACNLTAFEKDIPFCKSSGIAYYAASSLHFALLGSRFNNYCKEAPGGDYISVMDIFMAIKIKAIADKYGLNLASMSQRYLFSIQEASRITMGARNTSQIQSTIRDWKEGVLPEEIFNEITELVIDRDKRFIEN